MENKEIEIYIRTIPENKEEKKPVEKQDRHKKEQGKHEIGMGEHLMQSKIHYSDIPKELESIKPEIFKKLMTATKSKIKTVVEEMTELKEIQNVKAVELEFGIGFTQKLGISIFELGGNQSLKVKVIIEK